MKTTSLSKHNLKHFGILLLILAFVLGTFSPGLALEIIPISAPVSEAFAIGDSDFDYVDGPMAQASFRNPYGMAYDAKSNTLLIVDSQNHRIRTLDLATGQVSTLAGTSDQVDIYGFPAGGHKDGDALAAKFNRPRGIVIAPNGAIYIADTGNHAIRQIYQGKVYTVAGSGLPGYADGADFDAQFNKPTDIIIDLEGNLLVSDTLNNAIRKIAQDGKVTTLVGNPDDKTTLWEPTGLDMAVDGTLYVADTANHQVKAFLNGKLTATYGQGGQAVDPDTGYYNGANANGPYGEASFNYPKGISVLANGFVIVADTINHQLKAIAPTGYIYPFAGGASAGVRSSVSYTYYLDGPTSLVAAAGYLFASDFNNNRLVALPLTADFIGPRVDYSQHQAADLPVFVDGYELDFPDVQPFITEGKTQVPLRFIAEGIGADIRWDDSDATDRRAIVTKGGAEVAFSEAAGEIYIKEDRSIVGLRSLIEKLNIRIDWLEPLRAIIIESYIGR